MLEFGFMNDYWVHDKIKDILVNVSIHKIDICHISISFWWNFGEIVY